MLNVAESPSPRLAGGSARSPAPRRRLAWIAEWLLGLVAVGCLGFVAFATVDERTFQAAQSARLEALVQERLAHPPAAAAAAPRPRRVPRAGEPIGRLEIPAVGVTGMVTPGTDDGALRRGIGWIEGTALPGEPGNVALAAHRDTFFRGLRKVRLHDRIALRTPDGTFEYRIDDLRVVSPTDLGVLAPREQPALTLITCYPFDYIGSAPLRFVVHASQVGTAALAP